MVGDITAAELGPLLDRLFGDLPATGPAAARRSPRPRPPGTLAVIDLDIPQSVVVFGHGGIARDDPDFIPAFVMDHILGGGGFGSRLTEEVRERRGLTYGIYTYLAPERLRLALSRRASPAPTPGWPRRSASCAPNGRAWRPRA